MRHCDTCPMGVLAVGSVETLAFVDFNEAENPQCPSWELEPLNALRSLRFTAFRRTAL